ncbi:uncharacterized protein EI90DRAFT_854120 [Cantharellus anzutake]|uniref:uncharacterized protein n=1 Tax=Cantharellus anzutake TaxID=1750568 RepID=UPI00190873F2|nr:uncharacterized protein EI90DRAFT_854120 [Cantharellus anzutake]KAF8332386.1 hypothetical protein EI90DRAFT_854120 [Cantharellus anzutake]
MPAREHSRRPSTPMEKRDPRDSFEDPHPRSTTAKPPPRDYRSTSSYLSPEPASSVSPQVPSSNMNYGSLTRTRPTRSATTGPSPSATRPRHVPSRSMSSDSFERPFKKESANLSASTPPATDRPAKPVRKKSHHVDLIDQLDYSSLGQGTFHHDGPFDALAPSRNRNNIAKAPMRAFNEEEAILAAAAPPDLASSLTHPHDTTGQLLHPSGHEEHARRSVGKGGSRTFEEFSAGGYIGPGSNGAPISNRIMNGDDAASRAKDLELAARNARRNARIAPPPQPIFLPGSEFAPTRSYDGPTSPNENPFTPDGRPKRNKSLINRFRRVRDNPNIPPNPPYPPPGVANGYRYDDSPTEDKFSPSPTVL